MAVNDSLSFLVGTRYAGMKSGTHLLSFLARVAMAGLVLGVALLVVVLSVMNGFDRELRERILTLVPHVSFYYQHSDKAGRPDWDKILDQLRSTPGIKDAAPFIEYQGLLRNADNAEPLMLYGIEDYPALHDYIDASGLARWKSDPEGLLVSRYLAEKLSVSVGDAVVAILPVSDGVRGQSVTSRLVLHRFNIAGIYDTKTELDKALVVVHLATLAQAVGFDGPQGVRLTLQDMFRAPQMEWHLIQSLPEGFYGENWSETHGNLYEAVQMSRALVSMLMLVIIAVAVFNVVSTLVMVVIEKKQSIAILRVQGASRTQLVRVFMVQGAWIGITGALAGAVIGSLVSLVLPQVASALERAFHFQFLRTEVYPISYIPSDLRLGQVIAVVIVAVLFSLVASLYPALRATRIDPAQVLRYE